MHRLDLGLYSHPKYFGENEVTFTSSEKSPLPFSTDKDRTHDAASSRAASPTHYQGAIPAQGGFPTTRLTRFDQDPRSRSFHFVNRLVNVQVKALGLLFGDVNIFVLVHITSTSFI